MALEGSSVMRNFGVAGPLDVRDRHKHHMCFAFHPRLHYEIFGEFYPDAFQNWWSDYWVSLVYGPNSTFWFRDVEVRNTELEGRRYPAFWEGHEVFADQVAAGRLRLRQFCQCAAANGRWRFNACISQKGDGSATLPRVVAAPSSRRSGADQAANVDHTRHTSSGRSGMDQATAHGGAAEAARQRRPAVASTSGGGAKWNLPRKPGTAPGSRSVVVEL